MQWSRPRPLHHQLSGSYASPWPPADPVCWRLTEPSTNIVFRILLARIFKDLCCRCIFYQSTSQEEPCIVGDTSRLLHIVGHNDNSILLDQLSNQLFHLEGCNWTKR